VAGAKYTEIQGVAVKGRGEERRREERGVGMERWIVTGCNVEWNEAPGRIKDRGWE